MIPVYWFNLILNHSQLDPVGLISENNLSQCIGKHQEKKKLVFSLDMF